MKVLPEKTWIGFTNTKENSLEVVSNDIEQTIVNKEVYAITQYLKKELEVFDVVFEMILTLKQGYRDPRLERGINELGIISPDFGKEFTGLYFQMLELKSDLSGKKHKQKRDFLEPYLESLMKKYWINHITPYSNWEFNFQNKYAPQPKNGLSTSHFVNFPGIKVELIPIVGKTSE
jgi:hypothetical protein